MPMPFFPYNGLIVLLTERLSLPVVLALKLFLRLGFLMPTFMRCHLLLIRYGTLWLKSIQILTHWYNINICYVLLHHKQEMLFEMSFVKRHKRTMSCTPFWVRNLGAFWVLNSKNVDNKGFLKSHALRVPRGS